MVSTRSPSTSLAAVQYPQATIDRAERAIRCAPFQMPLFTQLCHTAVALREITGETGVANGYTKRPLPELVAENHLLWLIQVGILRREVDGQGLTDSFRLTPLGRQRVDTWRAQGLQVIPAASVGDRVLNMVAYWLRLQ